MNERELIIEERRWEKEKNLLEREFKLKKEKKALKQSYSNHISTSKLLIAFLFINCTLIELFTGWVTIKSIAISTAIGMGPDFAPLIALIGAVVGEVIGFAIYAIKSAKENSIGGIVYETAMRDIEEE